MATITNLNMNTYSFRSRKTQGGNILTRTVFHGRLKNEMFYGWSWYGVSLEQFMKRLDDYIHWYNEKRIKLSLGGMSPVEYRCSLGLI